MNLVVVKLNLHRNSRVHIWEHGLLEGGNRVCLSVCAGHPSPKERRKEAPSLLGASVPVPKFGDAVERFAADAAIKNRRGGAEQRSSGGRETVADIL